MTYKAFYESTIPGEASERDEPADEAKRLEFAKFLAPSNGELVRLEHDGELIWFRGTWVRVQSERSGDNDDGQALVENDK